jgi:hypothetical protein
MPKHLESIEIARPVEDVWRLLGQPERWLEGYVETRSRSPGYPAPGARNDHTFHTRIDEEVAVQVVRSGRPTLLERGTRVRPSRASCATGSPPSTPARG